MKKRYLIPVIFVAGYFLGPTAHFEPFDGNLSKLEITLSEIETWVAEKESKVLNLKPNNHSRIIWADSIRKTEYSIVYLHGFSASPMEGDPIHREFAQRYGANLYIPRLAGHGIQDDNAFENLTPKQLIDSAKEAIAIGQLLGEKIILMSCSTGSTLALYLGAENPEAFHSQIMYSPNIDLYDGKSALMTMPWGKQLTKMIMGDQRSIAAFIDSEKAKYWTPTYSTKGLIALRDLIDNTMTENILSKVNQPYFLGCYYKNEEASDHVVSVEKMRWFHKISKTIKDKKHFIEFPNAAAHVLTSDLQCKDLETVRSKTFEFAENVLGLTPVN